MAVVRLESMGDATELPYSFRSVLSLSVEARQYWAGALCAPAQSLQETTAFIKTSADIKTTAYALQLVIGNILTELPFIAA